MEARVFSLAPARAGPSRPALPALPPAPAVRADLRAPALPALRPAPVVRAELGAPALPAVRPAPAVRAEPALLARPPGPAVRAGLAAPRAPLAARLAPVAGAPPRLGAPSRLRRLSRRFARGTARRGQPPSARRPLPAKAFRGRFEAPLAAATEPWPLWRRGGAAPSVTAPLRRAGWTALPPIAAWRRSRTAEPETSARPSCCSSWASFGPPSAAGERPPWT
jgi:hypothetical protein